MAPDMLGQDGAFAPFRPITQHLIRHGSDWLGRLQDNAIIAVGFKRYELSYGGGADRQLRQRSSKSLSP